MLNSEIINNENNIMLSESSKNKYFNLTNIIVLLGSIPILIMGINIYLLYLLLLVTYIIIYKLFYKSDKSNANELLKSISCFIASIFCIFCIGIFIILIISEPILIAFIGPILLLLSIAFIGSIST